MALGPNEKLIGVKGSRRRLSTPALVLDLDAFERNLAAMARHCRAVGHALRPHVKGHKSPRVARLQIESGATGLSCATLFEAERMAAAGLSNLLITSPLATAAAIERVVMLNLRIGGVVVVTDNAGHADALDEPARASGRKLAVLVDFDVGQRRTGAASEDAAVELAGRVANAKGLEFAGLQGYYGHLQHVKAFAERKAKAIFEMKRLASLRDRLKRDGLAPRIVSGGGTGTFAIDPLGGVFTEVQPGSYPFLDVEYENVDMVEAGASPFASALFVQATVVSANQPGRVALDAGMKAISTDGPGPRLAFGAPAGAAYSFAGDEFGIVAFGEAKAGGLQVGDRVELVPSHCDTTMNLHDFFHCVRGDTLVDLWPIEARGRW